MNLIRNDNCKTIEQIAFVADGDHSKFPCNQPQEIRYLQAKDIKNHFIENDKPVFVGKKYFESQERSHIHEEDVILSIMGSVGDIAILPKGFKHCIANRAVAIIKQIHDVSPYYLFAFLSSSIGLQQIDQQKNGGIQQRINLDLLSKIKVPIPSISFQNKIETNIKKAHLKREQSQILYRQAEELLLETIGLKDFQPSREGKNIKSFKESFLSTGRLDA
ncbi:MAG: restriction endonuclease subunit S, partial [Prevotellaceae bacterium]|nr:restriction endonuclease subunit S [Prevotellaceae bacterium]